MKSIMIKSLCAIIIVSAVVLACTGRLRKTDLDSSKQTTKVVFDERGYFDTPHVLFKLDKTTNKLSEYNKDSVYGSYLAGRMALSRHDFDDSIEYFKLVYAKDNNNKLALRTILILLAISGDFEQAAEFAQKEIDSETLDTVSPFIVAIKDFGNKNYATVRSDMALNDKVALYKDLISPLVTAWSYAAENDAESAVKELDKIMNDEAVNSLKYLHKAMIYDFLGNMTKADENYSLVLEKSPQNISYRYLDIITNFYVRNGNKQRAQQIFGRFMDDTNLSNLLAEINVKIDTARDDTKPIIDSAQKGLAEALYSIGVILSPYPNEQEVAKIYFSGAIYLNPDYNIAKLALGSFFEKDGFLKEANRYYSSIPKDTGVYFISRMKMVENLNTLEDEKGAEKLLRNLLKEYPTNTQLLTNLGNILQQNGKNADAMELYEKALSSGSTTNMWQIHYMLGVIYVKENDLKKAEEHLSKALELSNREAAVLNYLGYVWLENNKNIDEAVKMIVEAYKKYPYDGHIVDSLGWAFFRLGKYEEAITYLEQASDMNPGNSVISDHLGDAYWFAGRKNEAVFQWKHALLQKEDEEWLDKKAIQEKIDNGNIENKPLKIEDESILEI